MVCNRCINAVGEEFKKINIMPLHIDLGEIELKEELSSQQNSEIQKSLNQLGFELLTDSRKKLIEKIKTLLYTTSIIMKMMREKNSQYYFQKN